MERKTRDGRGEGGRADESERKNAKESARQRKKFFSKILMEFVDEERGDGVGVWSDIF